MILLPFILLSSAQATGQYNVPQKPRTYCTELLPQILQGGTGSARPVSIEVSSKCAEKFSLSEVCVVSVKCALMPPLVDETAKTLIHKDFDSLTYPERFRVVKAIMTSDEQGAKENPNYERVIDWLPTHLVCLKQKVGTDPTAKKVCPEPEQCKVPTGDVAILDAEFDSHLMDEISDRVTKKAVKIFSPAAPSTLPPASTLPAK